MIRRSIGAIARMLDAQLVWPAGLIADEGIFIEGVSKDTRTIAPGALYIPLTGENFDGHAFAEEAGNKGAAATLWDKGKGGPPANIPAVIVPDTLLALQKLARLYREELAVKIVGITGSNGKTTTKDMAASVLSTVYRVHKTKGNLNNHIGLPLTLLQLDESIDFAVVEMGMSGRGEIELLSDIAQPDAAIITMIGEAHMLQLGSREEIARAKTEILSGLREGGLFIYNGDEPLIEQVLPEMKQPAGMYNIRFGAMPSNDMFPTAVRLDGDGAFFAVNKPEDAEFFIPLLGAHNVVNALAVIALAQELGIPEDRIAEGFRGLQLTSMRIEKLVAPGGLTVLNDAYNASPASMRAALELAGELSGFTCKRVVLGDMLELGGREEAYHREIGRLLEPGLADYVYTYGRLAKFIAEEARNRYPQGKVKWYEDKEALTDELAEEASPGDIVLVKGSRGMRLETVVQRLIGG